MQSLHRVEKSPPSNGTGDIGEGDLSTQSIIGAATVCLPYRHAAPLEMTKEPCHPTVMLKRKARLAPESLAVRMQKKRSPSFRGASFSSQRRLEYIVQGYGCYVIVVGIGAFGLYVEVVFAVESYVLSEGYIAFCTPEFNFFN